MHRWVRFLLSGFQAVYVPRLPTPFTPLSGIELDNELFCHRRIDLVAPPDLGTIDFDGVARLRSALSQAAKLARGSDRPFLTGRGSAADPESCSHIVANPAFALIAPVADRDDVGSTHPGFDGLNRAMADTSAHCIAAPGRAMDATYDDVVLAESASTLLGWLATTTR